MHGPSLVLTCAFSLVSEIAHHVGTVTIIIIIDQTIEGIRAVN